MNATRRIGNGGGSSSDRERTPSLFARLGEVPATLSSSPHPAFRQAMRGIDEVLAATIGTDSTWARIFPAPLHTRGLQRIGTAVHLPTTGGAGASAMCWALTLTRLRPHILERHLATDDVLDAALTQLADPDFADLAFATVLAWGRTPGATPGP